MQSPKKIRGIILSMVIMCLATTTQQSILALNFTPEEKDQLMSFVTSQSSWLKKAAWLIVPALVQITLSELLVLFFSGKKTDEEQERDKIESLISISHAMKNQMLYIKPICKDKKILENMEKRYVNSLSRILELHDDHLEKYAKKKKEGG